MHTRVDKMYNSTQQHTCADYDTDGVVHFQVQTDIYDAVVFIAIKNAV